MYSAANRGSCQTLMGDLEVDHSIDFLEFNG